MTKYGDWFIMLAGGIFIAIWLYRAVYRWLHSPVAMNTVKLGKGKPVDPDDEAVKLLKRAGYDVPSCKHIIRIPIEVDDELLEYGTRLNIDYIAEQDHCTYVVKLEHERKPADYSPSCLRDHLLMYSLILPSCAGVLIVNVKEATVRKVSFLIG